MDYGYNPTKFILVRFILKTIRIDAIPALQDRQRHALKLGQRLQCFHNVP